MAGVVFSAVHTAKQGEFPDIQYPLGVRPFSFGVGVCLRAPSWVIYWDTVFRLGHLPVPIQAVHFKWGSLQYAGFAELNFPNVQVFRIGWIFLGIQRTKPVNCKVTPLPYSILCAVWIGE